VNDNLLSKIFLFIHINKRRSVMKNTTIIGLIVCFILAIVSCSKDSSLVRDETPSNPASDLKKAKGATQLSGIGYFDATDECNSAGQGAAYAVNMTGDLQGCLYTYVDDFECSPSGTYREVGREYFVGTYMGVAGTFRTNYRFEAKYEGCAENGSYVGAEIKGRCQHPIADGSGTGVFEGVTGEIFFKDDIEAGNYPYRLHLKF
jgi:hypothetical protein